ncbi:periodic tryptophan protein 1 homolog [Microplitis mediator]|uniref:periodic tryptophan protein 1 homolog n=1 Tax=Microplitis mediator TaxID=375433 RepID=UPI0025524915|nr:periodic tryptophan protein 1 homolog [Microplitis mediator]
MNVIPCCTWVKKGVAAAVPDKVQLTAEELEGIIKKTESDLADLEADSDADSDNEPGCSNAPKKNDTPKSMDDEFNFENYDEEAGDIKASMGGLASINPDGKDPYITVAESDDNDSEKEDDIIKPDDNLVLLGHVDGDASILEVYVYNEREGSFYCHHDILLPSFPLCLEWLNFDPSDAKPGNFVAIGNMTSVIEVWDLDIVDCLEPIFKLGCKPNKKKNKKRVGHKDAVLDITWNVNLPHILASGSVDKTVLLWDIEKGIPDTKLDQFNEKVTTLQWHPQKPYMLLTGSEDKTVKLFDCRTSDTFKNWETTGEVERVLWNHFDPNYFFVGTKNGIVECIDIRQGQHLWQVKAHDKEITGLSLSVSCPGFLVTASDDGVIKVWDSLVPQLLEPVWETETNLGAIQCLTSSPDSPFIIAAGGDHKSNNFKVWDLTEVTTVNERFRSRKLIEPVQNNETDPANIQGSEEMEVTDE